MSSTCRLVSKSPHERAGAVVTCVVHALIERLEKPHRFTLEIAIELDQAVGVEQQRREWRKLDFV